MSDAAAGGAPTWVFAPAAGTRRAVRAAVRAGARPPRAEAFALQAPDGSWTLSGRRFVRSVRSQGARVAIVWTEGRLQAGGRSQAWTRLSFEPLAGPATALPLLAERWRKRFDLCLDPLAMALHAGQVAGQGVPARRARRPLLAGPLPATVALALLVDECWMQVAHNAAVLALHRTAASAEHVHQLRVGLRRLRSVWRLFRGWTPALPAELVLGVRSVFQDLGAARDADVLDAGVAAELAAVGAPALRPSKRAPGAERARTAAAADAQRVLMAVAAWRAGLAEPADTGDGAAGADLKRRADQRLSRWHRRLVDAARGHGAWDDEALHTFRKAAKRQRYAVELLASLWKRRAVERYLDRLEKIQERLGQINDLLVAREHHQALVERQPAAWFALGWLAARIAESRSALGPALARFVDAEPPWA